MIKSYKNFINELYTTDNTDSPELASDKTSSNKMQNDVKEFLSKKITVDNIYATYKDEKDLINKLHSQKFINSNTSDKSKIQFINPLIGLYAQASEKKRKLKSLEEELKNKKDDLISKKSLINSNPDTKDALTDDIAYVESKIKDTVTRISKLKSEIIELERSSEEKLKDMKANLDSNKKRLDYSINNR